jgi:6-phosphofructokinase 1
MRPGAKSGGPSILGFTNGFRGFIEGTFLALAPSITESWPRRGGSMLRQLRESKESRPNPAKIVEALRRFAIDILYIAGGDGSLQTAQAIRRLLGPDGNISVVHVPKTMDNDIPWVSESFGFQTAIAEAARLVGAIRDEAESNNRIGIVEVLGAGMGHTAAHTALASGEIDAVLVPEQGPVTIDRVLEHLDRRALGSGRKGYAVILAAEKVQPALDLDQPSRSVFVQQIERRFRKVVDSRVFVNQPKHFIRAVPANCQDQLYCRQLANGAVDCALAGYTGFSISKWLDSYVMVPFVRAAGHKKHLPLDGMVWKQVMQLTGQPDFS